MPSDTQSLDLAQRFIEAIERRDKDRIVASLADDVKQIFVMGGEQAQALGAFYSGKDEVLSYTFGLFDKFDEISWVHQDWTVSADGSRVFMQAQSDCLVAHNKAQYRNSYVMRFDVVDGRIAQILEYAVGELFLALEIPFSEIEQGAIERGHHTPYASIAPQ